jgi:Rieske Fe-S protein
LNAAPACATKGLRIDPPDMPTVTQGDAMQGRRRLLLVGGAAGAAGCEASGGEARPDARVAMDVDPVYLGLDGGLAYAVADGWSPGVVGVDVGPLADFAPGSRKYNGGARAIVARDARGLFAYSALCTHEGCLVGPPGADGVTVCPCHDSRFDDEGRPTAGPAARPLQRHAVRIVGGRVLVDPSSRVGDGARAVPPSGDGGAGDDDAAAPVDAPVDPCAQGADVGPLSAFAPGTWTRLADRPLIVGRDARGLFAYSARCPHQNCIVDAPAAGTGAANCACHGSRFDGNGHVTSGPARADLDHYPVHLCAGRVRVDAEQLVDPSTRTPAS